ncbi:MAG: hypothetical protein M1819_001197 [Sarea resinae]|nr:MAG: hypothetical protein M1819_001197 [Sarea resinae]
MHLHSFLYGSLALAGLASAGCPYFDRAETLVKRDNEEFLSQFELDDSDAYMTTDSGTPIAEQNTLSVGDRGPSLLEDFIFRQKITRFDHERVPERAVHARGAAAFGTFTSYGNWSNITDASFLAYEGKETDVLLRFSTVAGSRGSADTVRDVHGYSLRFYTDEGNFDVVGNNIPIFFIQDAIQFPDLIHAVKPSPDREIPQAATAHDSAWDFFSQNPSALHTVLWAMSGHGIPRSFRHVDGFGIHTFRLVDANGNSKLIKWHFKSQQGVAGLLWPEAQVLAGKNADFHREDLWNNIANGNFPSWEVGVQIMEEEDVLKYGFDLLDPTKIVPEEYVPITPLGKYTLNRNPTNYFAEVEQAMFCPSHVVRGIDFSDDPLLQGRLFSYLDTQLNRHGGPNFEQLPVNRPRVPIHNNNRDGAAQMYIPTNNNAYSTNTLNEGNPKQADQFNGRGFFTAPKRTVDGHYVRNVSPTFLDYWTQPRLFWNSITPAEQQMVVNAIRFELSGVQSMAVRSNVIGQLNKIAHELAARVGPAVGITPPAPNSTYYHDNTTADVATFGTPLPTVAGLTVAILATTANGTSLPQANTLATQLAALGIVPTIITETILAPSNATVNSKGNVSTTVNQSVYTATDAVLYDALVVTSGADSLFSPLAYSSLYPPGRPLDIVRAAYSYGKTVGFLGSGVVAMQNAGIPAGDGVLVAPGVNGTFVGDIENGLKTWRWLGRLPSD